MNKLLSAIFILLIIFQFSACTNESGDITSADKTDEELRQEEFAKEEAEKAQHINELESKTNSKYFDIYDYDERPRYSSELEETLLNKRTLVNIIFIDDIKKINNFYVGYFSSYNGIYALKLNENLYNDILKISNLYDGYIVVNITSLYKNIFEIDSYIEDEEDPVAKWSVEDTSLGNISFYGELLEIAEIFTN